MTPLPPKRRKPAREAPSRVVHVTVECVLHGDSPAMLDAMEKAIAEENYRPRIEVRGAGEQYGVFGSYSIKSGEVVSVTRPAPSRRAR